MAGFRVTRRRNVHELEVHDAEMARRAGAALFAADERVRAAVDELGFVEAELGAGAAKELGEAIGTARSQLGEAFRLNRSIQDGAGRAPGAAAERRGRNERIVQLCESAVGLLDEQTRALAARAARARRAPEILAGVRGDLEILRAHLPQARVTVEQLAARYSREALIQVQDGAAEAERLVAFAEHSASVAVRRGEAGQREQAHLALEASADAVRRAAALLDAVETFEVEALRAESVLAGVVEEARHDLAGALAQAPRSRALAMAIDALEAALAELPVAGVNTDPIGHLNRVQDAKIRLDAAVAAVRERAGRPIPSLEEVHRAIDDADRELDVARDLIADHPGSIGPEARTRLAEAERIRVDLAHVLGNEETRVTVRDEALRDRSVAMAHRVAELAGEAARLARRDIRLTRSPAAGEAPDAASWAASSPTA